MRILHLSDLQIEIRRNSQRFDEYKNALDIVSKAIKNDPKITKIALTGDIFEFCTVTDTERILFIEFIQAMEQLPNIDEIVITSGNHDLKQRFNDIIISGEQVIEKSVMDSLSTTFKGSKVQVLRKSGFFESISTLGLYWGVWAHEHRFDGEFEKYNPWNSKDAPNPENVIELYHDNFAGALNFNGQLQKGCEDAQGFSMFKAKTILAGHIHNPQIFVSDSDQRFIYASSLVTRDFGEGDYYINKNRLVDGLNNHGYYIHDINPSKGFNIENSTFVSVPQWTTRTTLTIDKNFNYSNLGELEIKTVSPYKNLVRINVIGNESIYHSNSALLTEHLTRQIPNMELTVDIDSSSIFASTSEQLDLELEELVTEEQILNIAIPFIKRKIRSTKRILEEDKEKAELSTIEMLKSQLSNLRKSVERNSIKLKHINTSNFLSYEDNVNIDFESMESLVKISGTNGIGKTNVFKLIKWVVDDLIDGGQARNTVNQNAMDVFNDKRLDTNTVSCEFVFINNNKKYTIIKEVERVFKTRSKSDDITLNNWRDHLKGIQIRKSLKIETSTSEEILTDLDVVQKELRDIFGTVKDMEALLFANASSLDRLVKSEPDVLADLIMHQLGLRYFQQMADDYENLREEKLSKLSKPSQTVESMVIEVATLKESKENGAIVIDTLTKDLKECESIIESKRISKQSLSETIHQIISPETINSDIINLEKEIEEKELLIKTNNNLIGDRESEILLNYKDFDKLIDDLNNSKSELKSSLVPLETKLTELNGELAAKKQEASTITAELRNEFQLIKDKIIESKKPIQIEINELNSKKETYLDKLNSLKHEYELKRNSDISTITNNITLNKNYILDTNGKIDANNKLITSWENSTKCVSCGSPIKDDALLEIQKRIKETELQNIEYTEKLTTLNNELSVLEIELSKVNESPDPKAWLAVNHENEINEAKKIIANITELNTTLANIDTEVEEFNSSIDSKILESERFKNIKSEHAKISNLIAEKQTEIEELNNGLVSKLSELDKSISILRADKLRLDELKDSINNLKISIPTLKMEVKLLEDKLTNRKGDIDKNEKNVLIRIELNEIDTKITEIEKSMKEISESLYQYNLKIDNSDTKIDTLEISIKNAVEYRIMESSLAIYKTFIGKKGFKPLVFDAVSQKLNAHMNDLLQESPYKLAFIDGVLNLIDSSNTESPVTRTPSAFSGMQTILGGLSLFYVIRNSSLGTRYDSVFIDEISGALNDGKDLSYDAVNYQQLLVKMIGKMRDTSKVYIVDHVLDFFDGSVLEVYPSINGSNIQEIIVPQA